MPVKFKRKIRFLPAYNKTSSDPAKNHDIADMRIKFILIGPCGAIQFYFSTGIFLPGDKPRDPMIGNPMGYDLGYHSHKPLYEDQEPISGGACDILNVPCYYNGSPLSADEYLQVLIKKGHKAVWKKMKAHYFEVFGDHIAASGK